MGEGMTTLKVQLAALGHPCPQKLRAAAASTKWAHWTVACVGRNTSGRWSLKDVLSSCPMASICRRSVSSRALAMHSPTQAALAAMEPLSRASPAHKAVALVVAWAVDRLEREMVACWLI